MQLVRDGVEFGELRMIEAKGFEGPMRAWPALGVIGRRRAARSPLVNRRRELALLSDTFERVRVASAPTS